MHEPSLSTPVHLRFFIVCMAYEMCNIFAQIEWPTTNTRFTQLRAGQRLFMQAVSCQNQGEYFCKFVVEGRNCQFGQYLCVIVTVYFTHILWGLSGYRNTHRACVCVSKGPGSSNVWVCWWVNQLFLSILLPWTCLESYSMLLAVGTLRMETETECLHCMIVYACVYMHKHM